MQRFNKRLDLQEGRRAIIHEIILHVQSDLLTNLCRGEIEFLVTKKKRKMLEVHTSVSTGPIQPASSDKDPRPVSESPPPTGSEGAGQVGAFLWCCRIGW